MKTVTLTRAEAQYIEDATEKLILQDAIGRELDRTEGSITLRLSDSLADEVEDLLHPHTKRAMPRGGFTNWIVALAIGGSALLGIGQASAHTNPCSQYGYIIGKEGVVRDSRIMHGAGCDDSRWARHYDEDEGDCAALARVIVNQNPWYWLPRPKMLAAAVKGQDAGCRQFEDGTYVT